MITHRGYYLFYHTVYCAWLLFKVATKQGQHFLNSAWIGESSIKQRLGQSPVEETYVRVIIYVVHSVVAWGWSKLSSCFVSSCFSFVISRLARSFWILESAQIPRLHVRSTSNSFPRFLLPGTSQVTCLLCLRKCETFAREFLGYSAVHCSSHL